MADNPLETIELELAILMRRIIALTSDKRFGSLERSGYLLLRQISIYGSAGVKALADEFNLDISTVSRQVAALEHKGYVYRIPDPTDGRAYALQITEPGIQELEESRQARMEHIAALIEAWPEDERQMFGQLLAKFNRSIVD
jgi:DNA-binding MarR family transcriptional regulator